MRKLIETSNFSPNVKWIFNCKCVCFAFPGAHSWHSCANQDSAQQCCSSEPKIGQIVNAKELSGSQKGTHFKVKKQPLVYYVKCKSPPSASMPCLSLDYQRFCVQDESVCKDLPSHRNFSGLHQPPGPCRTIGSVLMDTYALFIPPKKILKRKDFPLQHPNFIDHLVS